MTVGTVRLESTQKARAAYEAAKRDQRLYLQKD